MYSGTAICAAWEKSVHGLKPTSSLVIQRGVMLVLILCSSLSTWLLFDYSESSFFQYFVTIHDAKIQFIELRLHVYVYTAR